MDVVEPGVLLELVYYVKQGQVDVKDPERNLEEPAGKIHFFPGSQNVFDVVVVAVELLKYPLDLFLVEVEVVRVGLEHFI